MKYGVQVRATDRTVDLCWIARELERRGYESLLLPEHTHVPVNHESVHPGGSGLMEAAQRGFDPFVALAMAAASTTTLRIGTGICLIAQHDPIVLAKVTATLDHMSGGRLILGVGAGWAQEEMANHGVDPTRRWATLREKVDAVRAIWTEEQASFHGEFVRFDPIWQWPKPIQQPHPPILLAGEGPRALDRVVAYGDGWIPNWDETTAERIRELNRMSQAAGRGVLPTTVYATPIDADIVRECIAAGADRIVFNLPADDKEVLLQSLDEIDAVRV